MSRKDHIGGITVGFKLKALAHDAHKIEACSFFRAGMGAGRLPKAW